MSRVLNRLNSDHFVAPGLGANCLQRSQADKELRVFKVWLFFSSSLVRSFSSTIQQPVPVYSTCKSWSRLLKLRYSMKSWNRETLRNFHFKHFTISFS